MVSAPLRARLGAAASLLRPAEWVILLFLLYMARFDHTGMAIPPGMPLATVVAMLLVTLVRQVLRHRQRPWPEESGAVERFRVMAPRATAVAVVVLLVAVVGRLGRPPALEGGTLAGSLQWAFVVVRNVLAGALPALVLALGVGLHLKRHGALQPGTMVDEAAREAGQMVRSWAPPTAMIFLYGLMSAALGNLTADDRDPLLARIDRALCLGHDPVLALEHVIRPWLSEWLAFAYMAYLLLYPIGLGTIFAVARRHFDELIFALTLCLALGFVGYTLMPARGPMFAQSFSVSLDGYYLEGIKAQLMDRYRAPRDCFPSLHTAVALVFTGFAYRRARRLFWLLLPIAVSTPLACLYLRYHYLVDVLAGAALAAGCLALARAVYGRLETAGAGEAAGGGTSPQAAADGASQVM